MSEKTFNKIFVGGGKTIGRIPDKVASMLDTFMEANEHIIVGDAQGFDYHECVHNYMNLERVPPELAHRERMLVPISRYLKGEIDLALLLGAHKIMCYEERINETKGMLNYTAEGFELAGIEKKKI